MWIKSEKMLLPAISIFELKLWYLFDIKMKAIESSLMYGIDSSAEPNMTDFIKFWRSVSNKYWIGSKNNTFYYK